MKSDMQLHGSSIRWEKWSFIVLTSDLGVRLIDLHGTALAALGERLGGAIVPSEAKTALACKEIEEYLAGERKTFSSPLDIRGTPFQLSVWRELLRIPYGETRSYSEVAAAVGRPSAMRAVGAAVGANPIPIVVPCHRVVGKNGALVGFGGGLCLKERLLSLEGRTLCRKRC